MAGSYGWHFILFSVVFYLFIGWILSSGGLAYLDSTLANTTFVAGSYSTNYTNVSVNAGNYISYIWQNPFSNIAYLVWLSLAFLITDIYIIVTSLIP